MSGISVNGFSIARFYHPLRFLLVLDFHIEIMHRILLLALTAIWAGCVDGQTIGCSTTEVNTGLILQGACFDSIFAQQTCVTLGLAVAQFSTCTNGQYCCYVPSTSIGATTQYPGQVVGNNVCGVSQLNQQNGAINGANSGVLPIAVDGQIGIVTPRDDTPSRLSRILGGNPVQDMSRYCWIAAIYAGNNYIASGAIVNSNYIITSASAVKNYRSQIVGTSQSSQSLTVRLGQTSLNLATTGVGSIQYQVQSVQLYSGYRQLGAGYPVGDVALLRLSTPIDFTGNPSLCGACLPTSNQSIVGERCHAAGYGVTFETELVPGYIAAATITDGVLRDVLVPLIPRPVCDMVYRQVLRTPAYTTDQTSLCAGGELGRDTCLKDGGAPLSCIGIVRQYYIVAGLSSWGNGCGRYGTPSVYADLSNPAVLSWIRSIAGASFPIPSLGGTYGKR